MVKTFFLNGRIVGTINHFGGSWVYTPRQKGHVMGYNSIVCPRQGCLRGPNTVSMGRQDGWIY